MQELTTDEIDLVSGSGVAGVVVVVVVVLIIVGVVIGYREAENANKNK